MTYEQFQDFVNDVLLPRWPSLQTQLANEKTLSAWFAALRYFESQDARAAADEFFQGIQKRPYRDEDFPTHLSRRAREIADERRQATRSPVRKIAEALEREKAEAAEDRQRLERLEAQFGPELAGWTNDDLLDFVRCHLPNFERFAQANPRRELVREQVLVELAKIRRAERNFAPGLPKIHNPDQTVLFGKIA
jgi:hypothetical protein